MSERDRLKEIIGTPLENFSYASHPMDEVLRKYISGRLDKSGPLGVAELRAGSLKKWHRAEVTAHLLTCRRCTQLVAELRTSTVITPTPSRLKVFFDRLLPTREPVPTLARSVMIVQFAIILSLVGVIYFKPEPFFSPQSPVASILPPSEATKPHLQSPQPQGMTLHPPDSYPHTVHVIFREDTSVREIEGLVQSVSGMLVLTDQSRFVIKLPPAAGEQLDSIVQTLSQNPYVIEARKD
jgi:hypothetical protein